MSNRRKVRGIKGIRPTVEIPDEIESVENTEELHEAMKHVAHRAVTKLSADLVEAGASMEQVMALRNAIRAQVALEVLLVDFDDLEPGEEEQSLQQILFGRLMVSEEQAAEFLKDGLPLQD